MGAYLSPSAVIGLGPWGREVARGAEGALRERSPLLARACPVLALPEEGRPSAELIRAHLRASRMAELIRTLEQEGLMRLDPVISPATNLYLVLSLADDPDLKLCQEVLELAHQTAREMKATVLPVALIDLGDGRPPAGFKPTFPVYVLEPVTDHGLVLDASEYRAAVIETLVAVAQPGGSSLLAEGRPGFGTFGIAWLTWSPADLRASIGERMSREALLRCLEEGEPAPQFRAGLRESPAWRAQSSAQRMAKMLEGLPFRQGYGGEIEAAHDLFGEPERPRNQTAVHLRRCAAVLERRLERWQARLERNAVRQAEAEAHALDDGVTAAVGRVPDGLARARALAEAIAREAAERQAGQGLGPQVVKAGPALKRLEQAERLPQPEQVAGALTAGAFLVGLLWRLIASSWSGLAVAASLAAIGVLVYWLGRPRHIQKVARHARLSLDRRAASLVHAALLAQLDQLDQLLEARASAMAQELERAASELAGRCRHEGVEREASAQGGALCFPLLNGPIDPVYRDLQGLGSDLTAAMAAEGVLGHWREPDRLLEESRLVTERFLAGQLALDPAQLATRVHGDRLAEHLQQTVRGLLDWAQPLLARSRSLPEGQRWLLWPEGLPCPPVASDVKVLTAKSCAAAITVIESLPMGVWADSERQTS